MKMKFVAFSFLVLVLFLGMSNVVQSSNFYPDTFIREEVNADYLPNGTLLSVSREGSVEVDTGGEVLKDVSLELDLGEGTNLEDVEAYRPAVSSPVDDTTPLYVETDDPDNRLSYEIDPDRTPEISVEVDYENSEGGEDIHTGENLFDFDVIIESDEYLEDAELVFQVPTSTGPMGQDSFDLKNHVCTGDYNYCRRVNKEGHDHYYERVEWSGDLYERDHVMISFQGKTEPGTTFNPDIPLDMDMGEYVASHRDGTFTGTTFEDRYSKASARNGIDMTQRGDEWRIEGFLTNRANNLVYSVDGWELYRIDDNTDDYGDYLNSSTVDENIGSGETIYTDPYFSYEEEKQYYFAEFDWKVQWGDSIYIGDTVSEVEMPLLYLIETDLYKDLDIRHNNVDERSLTVKDRLSNVGHREISADSAEIVSFIPNESLQGHSTSWNIDDVSVEYVNDTGRYDITNDTELSVNEPSQAEGYVKAEMESLNETVDYFDSNDDIFLEYVVTSSSVEEDREYSFRSESTTWSESGTPDTQEVSQNINISGVDEPEPDPPTPTPTEPPRLDLENIESTVSVVTGNLVEVKRSDMIRDTGDVGAREIDLGVLLPGEGELEIPSIEVHYLREGEWNELHPVDYSVEEVGERTIDGETLRLYEIDIMDDREQGLVLDDGEMVNLTYNARLDFGRNDVVTRVSYYDYHEDSFLNDDITTPVRVGWEADPMDVHRDRWVQDEANVGDPVRWTRNITVNNPNDEPMSRTLEVDLPEETFYAYLGDEKLDIKETARRSFVTWEVDMGALERETFTFEAYTSPVVFEEEQIEILNYNETSVDFLFNKTFRNTGPNSYEDVRHVVDIPPESILEVAEEGGKIDYSEVNGATELNLGSFDPEGVKSVTTKYRELPPVLVVSPDSYNYTYRDGSEITILAVGEEGHLGGHLEVFVTGPQPSNRETYSEIITMDRETKEAVSVVDLSDFPDGEYNVKVSFRRNFRTILTEETSFHVDGRAEVFSISAWMILVLLFVILGLILHRVYRRKDQYERRIEQLRRKAEEKF